MTTVVYTSYFDKNILYVGGSSGFFYKKHKQNFINYPDFEEQTWFINKIDNDLFCGYRHGLLNILATHVKLDSCMALLNGSSSVQFAL